MTYKLILSLSFAALLPMAALATEDDQCASTCEELALCASDAEQAIYDGVFSGSGCSDYEECGRIVLQCQADAGECANTCEY